MRPSPGVRMMIIAASVATVLLGRELFFPCSWMIVKPARCVSEGGKPLDR